MKVRHWIVNHLFLVSLLSILSGFVIMAIDIKDVSGGNSFHQITVAPVFLLLGYSLLIFAIIKRKK